MCLGIELYKKMYLIRKTEETIIKYYPEDEMKTPMHMSMGEEAIVAGVCQSLSHDDQVFGTYRSHALFLAKTGDVCDFFAEMYGKDTARLKGKGGSMHMCAPMSGFMGSSAIVASSIPVALGAAYANKRAGNNKIVATFFGDGATDEGVFWESMNIACLMKIPIIFICEDNEFAVHTPGTERRGYSSLPDIIAKFNCNVLKGVATDVEEIYQTTMEGINLMRKNQMPVFLHFKYYRYLEHVGIFEDFDAGYREKEEFLKWQSIDPVSRQRSNLLSNGYDEKEIENLENEIDLMIKTSIMKAKLSPFCDAEELFREVCR